MASPHVSPPAGTDLLDAPLGLARLAPADRASRMLDALQSNILHPHVRSHLRLLALRIDEPSAARRALAGLARGIKTAAQQLDELRAHREGGKEGTAFVCVGLSASGYERLAIPHEAWPRDPAFLDGMGRRDLADPAPHDWQKHYRHGIDALIVVGSHGRELTERREREVLGALAGSVSVIADETGRTLRNADGAAIEHFGYIDGRSQPLFLEEDLEHERMTTDGAGRWNPLVPLRDVLVRDPGVASADHCFGSYLVYRKLEQNVHAFKKQEARIARELRLHGGHAERAGALLVGRFEDGTAVALQRANGMDDPVPNDFTYVDDPAGARCPGSAHIRRMNARPAEGAPRTVIARRGQGYGTRDDDPDDDDLEGKPKHGVGLLFMAVVARIEEQFEALQHAANGDDGGPFDAVIGQRRAGAGAAAISLSHHWGDPTAPTTSVDVEPTVTMRGGEYLFLPSVEFLCGLDPA
jgi:deferrochelatase/peroxidase EfeB